MELQHLQEKTILGIKQFEAEKQASTEDELLFHYMDRINEEVGVLASNVFGNDETLPAAFANAIYSLSMLAKKMNVNLQDVIAEKIQQVEDVAKMGL